MNIEFLMVHRSEYEPPANLNGYDVPTSIFRVAGTFEDGDLTLFVSPKQDAVNVLPQTLDAAVRHALIRIAKQEGDDALIANLEIRRIAVEVDA